MLNRFTEDYLGAIAMSDFTPRARVSGRLASYDGLLMEAVGLKLPVGTVCAIGEGDGLVKAEVIGFRGGRTLMMNLGGPAALLPNAPVRPIGPRVRPMSVRRCSAAWSTVPVNRSTGLGRSAVPVAGRWRASCKARSIVAASACRWMSGCGRSMDC